MDKKVQFICIGVQKAGTTWIHRILDEHPQICVAHGKDKDTMYFGATYDRGYEWYERHFEDCEPDSRIGEVSTSYFYNSDAPERIKKYNENIKLFVCLRNPVDRIISNHKHEVRLGHISGKNLELEVALRNNPAYVMQSSYAKHIQNWYEYFDKKQIHIVLFDDIVNRPSFLAHELYKYLEVDENYCPNLNKKDNVSRIPSSRKVEIIIKLSGKAIRTVGLGKIVDVGRKYGLNDWLRSKNTDNNKSAVIIKSETVDELRGLLRPEILELSDITGIDLSFWLKD